MENHRLADYAVNRCDKHARRLGNSNLAIIHRDQQSTIQLLDRAFLLISMLSDTCMIGRFSRGDTSTRESRQNSLDNIFIPII
jgi:hypothetical protein